MAVLQINSKISSWNNIYYLTVSVGQESGHSFTGCLWLKMSCHVGLWSSHIMTECGETTSMLTLVVVGNMGLSTKLPQNKAAGFPQGEWCKRKWE